MQQFDCVQSSGPCTISSNSCGSDAHKLEFQISATRPDQSTQDSAYCSDLLHDLPQTPWDPATLHLWRPTHTVNSQNPLSAANAHISQTSYKTPTIFFVFWAVVGRLTKNDSFRAAMRPLPMTLPGALGVIIMPLAINCIIPATILAPTNELNSPPCLYTSKLLYKISIMWISPYQCMNINCPPHSRFLINWFFAALPDWRIVLISNNTSVLEWFPKSIPLAWWAM